MRPESFTSSADFGLIREHLWRRKFFFGWFAHDFFSWKPKFSFGWFAKVYVRNFFFFFQKLTFFKTFFEPLFTLILFYHLIEKLSWPWESFFPRSQIMGFSNKFYKNSTFLTEFKTKINTWAADHCWPPSLQKKYIGRGIFI